MNNLKEEYKKNTDYLRANNLKKLREEIARLSLSDFSRETGMTKNDISLLENSEKTLSLTHMLAYKKYFAENHNIDLSMDYLMGFTDIMENNNVNFQKETCLSVDSIKCLKFLQVNDFNSILTLNFLMGDGEKFLGLLQSMHSIIVRKNNTMLPDQKISFIKECEEENSNNSIVIDESILKTYSLLKINEIIENYSISKK